MLISVHILLCVYNIQEFRAHWAISSLHNLQMVIYFLDFFFFRLCSPHNSETWNDVMGNQQVVDQWKSCHKSCISSCICPTHHSCSNLHAQMIAVIVCTSHCKVRFFQLFWPCKVVSENFPLILRKLPLGAKNIHIKLWLAAVLVLKAQKTSACIVKIANIGVSYLKYIYFNTSWLVSNSIWTVYLVQQFRFTGF